MTPTEDRRRGVAVMIAAMVFIAVVDAGAKWLGADGLPAIQIVWGYFAGILAGFAVLQPFTGTPWRRIVATRRPVLQMVRAATLVASLGLLFTALPHLALADATAISFASPLFVTILSVPLLGERVGPHRWAAVLAGFAGVAIVIRPGAEVFQWAAVLPLVGALFFALYQIITRTLAQSDDLLTTLFYTAAGGLVLTGFVQPFVWQAPTAVEWGAFAALGACGVAAHWLIIRAFALAPASLLAPFNYTRIVWATLLGWWWFATVPDVWALVGAALIVASGLHIVARERAASKRRRGRGKLERVKGIEPSS